MIVRNEGGPAVTTSGYDDFLFPETTAYAIAGVVTGLAAVRVVVTYPQDVSERYGLVAGPIILLAAAVFLAATFFLSAQDLHTATISIAGSYYAALGLLVCITAWALTVGDRSDLLRAVTVAVVMTASVYVLALLANGGLGLADVRLCLLTGLYTGWTSTTAPVTAAVIAVLAGGAAAAGILVARNRGLTTATAMPYGPCILLAAGLVGGAPL